VTSGDVRDEEEANAVQPGQARLLGGRGGGGGGVFGRGSQRLSPTQGGGGQSSRSARFVGDATGVQGGAIDVADSLRPT
jgi:hypothetical protein